MDMNLNLRRISTQITTGIPQTANETTAAGEGGSFKELLSRQIEQASGLNFSKHAINRVIDRNIDVSEECMERLNKGAQIAQEKGLTKP
ncbi:MAG: hypothetical protein QM689_07815 [Oscillospiraceae bacterium]